MKKPNMESRVAKYYIARKSGKTKKESAITAGYAENTSTQTNKIENTNEFRTIELYFKDELKNHITMSQIAEALTDNIMQPNMKVIDRGSRNKAIEIALNKLEPDNLDPDIEERVIIVMKK